MNKDKFFTSIKASLFTKFTQDQVDGINHILDSCTKNNICDLRYVAYILATAFHETAKTMRPIEEYGKGKGYDYGKKLKMSRQPYTVPDKIYFGRGYVQLTWYENYQSLGKILGIDLLNKPELALDKSVASDIMIAGMTKGLFTGKSLKNYFNDTATDWVNARKIINGLDKAELIAGYAKKFYTALTLD